MNTNMNKYKTLAVLLLAACVFAGQAVAISIDANENSVSLSDNTGGDGDSNIDSQSLNFALDTGATQVVGDLSTPGLAPGPIFDVGLPIPFLLTDVLLDCQLQAGCGDFEFHFEIDYYHVGDFGQNTTAVLADIAGFTNTLNPFYFEVDVSVEGGDSVNAGRYLNQTAGTIPNVYGFNHSLLDTFISLPEFGPINITVAGWLNGTLSQGDLINLPASFDGQIGSARNSVPEPSTYVLFLAGLAGLAAFRRRRS